MDNINNKTVKVRFLTSCAGDHFSYAVNQVAILAEKTAKSFINAGIAVEESETMLESTTRESIEAQLRIQLASEHEESMQLITEKVKELESSLDVAEKSNLELSGKLEESEKAHLEVLQANEKLHLEIDKLTKQVEALKNKVVKTN